jgi:hypothetical protein
MPHLIRGYAGRTALPELSQALFALILTAASGLGATPNVQYAGGQESVILPESSVVHAEDHGLRAHTNHLIVAAAAARSLGRKQRAETASSEDQSGSTPYGKSPADLRKIYQLPPTGGAGIIALVEANDDPTAEIDLGVFSSQFGLPPCTTSNGCFRKIYATGSKPSPACSWAQEADLDIEWAHALAPNAQIVLVEAASNTIDDLTQAVRAANSLVSPGGTGFGEISMSWGFAEFSGESQFDVNFAQPGVVYVAGSGDIGGQTSYPAASPYVVAAGGTRLNYTLAGEFLSESAWSNGGGGPSIFESRPVYQDSIVTVAGAMRGTPDVSFDADPRSGVAVYDSTPCGGASDWLVAGGTSVSAPAVAAIINLAGHFYTSTDLELQAIYSQLGTSSFRDITIGRAGPYTATPGWDFITGAGSILGAASATGTGSGSGGTESGGHTDGSGSPAGTSSGANSGSSGGSNSPGSGSSGAPGTPEAVFSARVFDFGFENVGTTSAPKVLTLRNGGNAPLNLRALQITANYSETNDCAASLQPGASCSIQLTFAPSAPGAQNGSLLVVDNAAGGSQSAVLTGTGVDFLLSASPNSATVSAGNTAQFGLDITPSTGFNGPISLACSGVPSQGTCSVTPLSVIAGAGNTPAIMVRITTMGAAGSLSRFVRPRHLPPAGRNWPILLAFFLPVIFLRPLTKRARSAVASAIILALFCGACGGGSAGSMAVTGGTGTPAGTYIIVVTATSGSLVHQAKLTLVVH